VDAADFALFAEDWLKYVKPPAVKIVEPLEGAVFMTPSTEAIEIKAEAWDVDGPIVKVEFFANDTLIGEDTNGADGWKISWQGYVAAIYTLTAKATEKNGVSSVSPPVKITVVTPR